jgi:hypothetical protein
MVEGELAVNTADQKLYSKDSTTVFELGAGGADTTNLLSANYTWGGAGIPAAGEVRSDTATLKSLTLLRFDDDTSDGVDDFAAIAVNLRLGQLIEIANADLSEYNTFRIDAAIVDQTTRWDVPVKYIGGTQSVSGNFTASSAVRVSINPVEIDNAVNNGIMYLDALGNVETDGDLTYTGTIVELRSGTNLSIYSGTDADYMRTRLSSGDTTAYVEHIGAGSYDLRFEDWGFVGFYNGSTLGAALYEDGSLKLREQAAKLGITAAMGQIWVKNDVPNTLWFTDDGDNDFQLGTGGAQTPWASDIDGAGFGLDNIDRLEIQAPGIPGDTVTLSHNGTDFNADFVNTTDWNFNDLGRLKLFDACRLQVIDTTNSLATDIYQNGAGLSFLSVGATSYNVLGFTTCRLRDGVSLSIEDSTDTKWCKFSHDGVDFNAAFTGTTDWNITGLTAIQAGTVDADFDNLTATNFTGSSSGSNTGDNAGVTSVAGGTGITSSGGTTPSISLDLSELGVASMVTGDWIAFDNAGVSNKALISGINLSLFNDDLGHVENATHTGQVTGATALALGITAITAQPASGAIIATDTILTNDGGVLSETTFTQLNTYFDSSLGFGVGTVTNVNDGNGMTFTAITGTGDVTMGTPGSITDTSTNAVTTNSHTHAVTHTGTGNFVMAAGPTITGTLTTATIEMADNILRRPYIDDYALFRTTLTATATTTLNYSTAQVYAITMNANITTLSVSNEPASGRYGEMTLKLIYNSATARTIDWTDIGVKWGEPGAPTLTSVSGKHDVIHLWTDDAGATWYGSYILNY